MARIVGVHGIGQENKGRHTLAEEWVPAMRDGVAAAGGEIGRDDLVCAFYGGLFRAEGGSRDVLGPALRLSDVEQEFTAGLLEQWWKEASRIEPTRVASPDADLRTTSSRSLQMALRALSRSRYFATLTERALIGSLRQVDQYMNNRTVRNCAQESVDAAVSSETRVIVAHSLGSVVAYEALCRYVDAGNWANVSTLVTLGSPLGIRYLIFDRLEPNPRSGVGAWPDGLDRWANISDNGDVVALEKRLAPLFNGNIVDVRVNNGATAHNVRPYLTAKETGEAVLVGLSR